MDRREAIEILTEYRRYTIRETIAEALDLAIGALQEPTEEVDYCNNCPYISWDKDCISRQQAIDGLCQNCEAFDCIVNGSYCGHDCTEVAIVKGMPPVEPKRPKGEWERFSFPDGEVMECTNCGYRDWGDVWEEESRNYCPNCGADMRGDTE